jgi:hypothetical protein
MKLLIDPKNPQEQIIKLARALYELRRTTKKTDEYFSGINRREKRDAEQNADQVLAEIIAET